MNVRSKLNWQLISLWRSLRALLAPDDHEAPARTSPLLIFIAAALAVFLAIAEIERHRSELESLGLLSPDGNVFPTAFVSP